MERIYDFVSCSTPQHMSKNNQKNSYCLGNIQPRKSLFCLQHDIAPSFDIFHTNKKDRWSQVPPIQAIHVFLPEMAVGDSNLQRAKQSGMPILPRYPLWQLCFDCSAGIIRFFIHLRVAGAKRKRTERSFCPLKRGYFLT